MDNKRTQLARNIEALCAGSRDENYTKYLEMLLLQLRQGRITEAYAAFELNPTCFTNSAWVCYSRRTYSSRYNMCRRKTCKTYNSSRSMCRRNSTYNIPRSSIYNSLCSMCRRKTYNSPCNMYRSSSMCRHSTYRSRNSRQRKGKEKIWSLRWAQVF